jgi:hypothetical protein
MGFIAKFLTGTVVGSLCVIYMDDYYYKVLKRNVADPVAREFDKPEIDVADVGKIVSRGLQKSYKELYP